MKRYGLLVGLLLLVFCVSGDVKATPSGEPCHSTYTSSLNPLCRHILIEGSQITLDERMDVYTVLCIAYDDGTADAVGARKRVCQTVNEWIQLPGRLTAALLRSK